MNFGAEAFCNPCIVFFLLWTFMICIFHKHFEDLLSPYVNIMKVELESRWGEARTIAKCGIHLVPRSLPGWPVSVCSEGPHTGLALGVSEEPCLLPEPSRLEELSGSSTMPCVAISACRGCRGAGSYRGGHCQLQVEPAHRPVPRYCALAQHSKCLEPTCKNQEIFLYINIYILI